MNYYINRNPQNSGEHEIHKDNCRHLPDVKNRKYLVCFYSFADAKKEALKYYKNVDGCYYCSPEFKALGLI